jgi:phage/plasmid-associated DNA primase
VVVSVDDLDRHADLLAVANGTLDLRTGTLMVPEQGGDPLRTAEEELDVVDQDDKPGVHACVLAQLVESLGPVH